MRVNLISDFEFENQVLNEVKKAPLEIEVVANVGEKICVKTNLFGQEICFYGNVLEGAKSRALSEKELEDCFNKNEFFKVNVKFETNGVFVLKADQNGLRREFFEKVKEAVLKAFSKNEKLKKIVFPKTVEEFKDFEFVEGKNQKLSKKNIIYSPEIYDEKDIVLFKEICEKQNKKMFLDLPNFALDKDVQFLKNIVLKNALWSATELKLKEV